MSPSTTDKDNKPYSVNIAALIALAQYARYFSLKPNRVLNLHSGDYQSPFKGRGMEYEESRLYQPGDDIRNMDWPLTARSGKPHTKLFYEERERPVFIWVDYRAPMFFATRGKYKSVIATEVAALLAWSAFQYGDRIGGVCFSEQVQQIFKPRRGRSSVLYFINQLVQHPAWQIKNNVAHDTQSAEKALLRLRRVVHPGSLIFLLSDFRHFSKQAISHITNMSRHNKIVMVFIYDKLEEELPPADRYQLRDEQQSLEINTQSKRFRKNYIKQFELRRSSLQQLAQLDSIDYLECSTQDVPYIVLMKGLYS